MGSISMVLRLLGWKGIAGIGVALVLGIMLMIQKGETRHWKKQSGQFEQLYHAEQSAFAQTVANYRAAAVAAHAADQAAAQKVATEQQSINERSNNDLETRLADARARAERLQRIAAAAAADPGARRATSVPGLPAAAGGAAQGAGQDRLSAADALTATEQAIQLDELIKWTRQQHQVDPNAKPAH